MKKLSLFVGLFLLGMLAAYVVSKVSPETEPPASSTDSVESTDPIVTTDPTDPTIIIDWTIEATVSIAPTYGSVPTEPTESTWSHEAALSNLLEETNRTGG